MQAVAGLLLLISGEAAPALAAIAKVQGGLAGLQGSVAEANKGFSLAGIATAGMAVVSALAVAGAAVVGFGLESAKALVDSGQAAYDMSIKFGIAKDKASEWVAAGTAVGVSAGAVNSGFLLLSRRLETMKTQLETTGHVAKGTLQPFKDLGINVFDANGHLKDASEIMLELADAAHKMGPDVDQAAMFASVLGRSGAALLPLLDEGRAGIVAYMAQAKALGATLSIEQVDAAHKAFLAQQQLTLAWNGATSQLGAYFLPMLITLTNWFASSGIPMLQHFVGMFKPLGDAIGSFFSKVGEGENVFAALGDVLHLGEDVMVPLGSIWDHLAKAFQDSLPQILRIVRAFGPDADGVGGAIRGLLPIVSGLITGALDKIAPVLKLIADNMDTIKPILFGVAAGFIAIRVEAWAAQAATIAANAALLLTKTFGFIEFWIQFGIQVSLARGAMVGVGAEAGTLSAAMEALGVSEALAAWPLALIAVGIAALVGGFILAYQHIQPFHAAVDRVWGVLKGFVADLQNGTGVFFAIGDALLGLGVKGSTVSAIVSGLRTGWDAVTAAVSSVASALGTAFAAIITTLQPVTDAFAFFFNSVGQIGVFNALGGALAILGVPLETVRGLVDGLHQAWDIFTTALGAVASIIGTAFSAIVTALGPVVDAFSFFFNSVGQIGVFNALAGALGVLGVPLATARGFVEGLQKAWEGVQKFLPVVGGALLFLTGPIGMVIAAVALAVTHWKEISGILGHVAQAVLPVLGAAWNGLSAAFQQIVAAVLPALAGAWKQLQPIISEFGESLKTLWPVLVQLGQFIGSLVVGALQGMAAAWKQIQPAVEPTLKVFGVLIGVVLAVVGVIAGALISGVFKGLVGFLTTFIPAAIQTVVDALRLMGDSFRLVVDVIRDVATLIGDVFSGKWGRIGDDVKKLFGDLGKNVLAILQDLIVGIGHIIENGGKVVNATVGGFVSGVVGFFVWLWGQVGDKVTAIWNQVAGGFQSGIAKVGGFFSGLGTAIHDKLAAVGEQIGAAFSQLGTAVHDKLAAGLSTVSAVWDQLRAAPKAILDGIVADVQGFVGGVVGFFQWLYNHNYYFKDLVDGIRNLWNTAWKDAQAIWSTITNAVTGAWNRIKTAAEKFMHDEETGFRILWARVQGLFATVWTAIHGFLLARWSAIQAAADTAWKLVQAKILAPLGVVWQVVQQIAVLIHDWLAAKWKAIQTTADAAWKLIQKTVIDPVLALWANITATLGKVLPWLQAQWNAIVAAASKGWQAFIDAIKAKVKDAVDAATSIGQSIADFFTGPNGILTKATTWGENLIKNFIQGIKNKLGDLKNMAGSAAQVIASFLGFHSPPDQGPASDSDKWMPNMIQMLASGIQDGIPQIQAGLGAMFQPPTFTGPSLPTPFQANGVPEFAGPGPSGIPVVGPGPLRPGPSGIPAFGPTEPQDHVRPGPSGIPAMPPPPSLAPVMPHPGPAGIPATPPPPSLAPVVPWVTPSIFGTNASAKDKITADVVDVYGQHVTVASAASHARAQGGAPGFGHSILSIGSMVVNNPSADLDVINALQRQQWLARMGERGIAPAVTGHPAAVPPSGFPLGSGAPGLK